jgi:large exoprotein involved in heme utilization and adhesion
VTGGDPSAIAGRVTSNGGVALVNPAGITFHNGAQVDVGALIATTSDITNRNFMAGRMAFDGAPRPGARVENRGSITVREQGLAALVGPAAANSGVIRARLGRVAIAGAEAFTLDLAGDGLLSFDVTRQVTAAPAGATALATNSGVIEAEGGHVLLTARAASGVLETLVSAGGTITAAAITANAPGGGVLVPLGATLDASGPTGGRVTVGAGQNSRIGAPESLSARTTVERGATLRADGTRGAGGQIIVHAAERTEMRGRASARGTPGGRIEVSSRRALALDASLDAGANGQVLLDPESLHIVETLSGSTEPAEVTAATVNTTPGSLILQADRRIRVLAEVNRDAGPLTLETTNATAAPGDGISIERPMTVIGDLRLTSAGDITQAATGAALNVTTLFAESRAGAVRLEAGDNVILALDGGRAATRFDLRSGTGFSIDAPLSAGDIRLRTPGAINLFAPVAAANTLDIVALEGLAQQAFGAGIVAATFSAEAVSGPIALAGAGNRIGTLGDITAPAGFTLRNGIGVLVGGVLAGGPEVVLTAEAGDIAQGAAAPILADRLRASAPAGSVLLDNRFNVVSRASGNALGDFVLETGGALTLDGRITAARIALTTGGSLTQETDALLTTPELRVRAGGDVALNDPLNAIASLGESGAGGTFSLATFGDLRLTGRLAAPTVALIAGGGIGQVSTAPIETASLRVQSLTGDVALADAPNAVAVLETSAAAGAFALTTTGALHVAGALDAPSIALRAEGGSITQGSAGITTASLRAEAADSVRLDAGANAIAALAGRAGVLFRVATAGALTPDDIAAPGVALRANGAIAQTGTIGIAADLLSAESGARVDLAAGANAIRELGRVVAPAGLAIATGTSLRLTEALAVPEAQFAVGGDLSQFPFAPLDVRALRLNVGGGVTLESPGNAIARLLDTTVGGDARLTTSGALALEGAIRAGGAITLLAAGSLTQPSGFVEAPVLVARSTFGNVVLDGANLLGAAGGGAAGVWRLRHDGLSDLRLAGLIFAPQASLTLGAGLDEAGGSLRADILGLNAAGMVRLEGGGHRVSAISGRAGALRLSAGGPLDITGALDVGDALALQADRIGVFAPVAAGGPALLFATAGDIAQSAGGVLTLPSIEAYAAGAVALGGAGNRIAAIAGGSAAGGFALSSDIALRASGGIGGETVTLRSLGALTLDGARFQAGNAVLLASPAGIEAGSPSRLDPLDAGRLPVLILDTRRAAGLTAIPAFVAPDVPGLPAASQPTQLAMFGGTAGAAAGGAAFDIVAGASPVFILLDGAPSVGAMEAGRLGVLGQGASAFLVGVVGGVGGEEAAALVRLSSGEASYRFNGCPMGAANCGALPPDPPVVPPVGPPVVPPVDPPVGLPVVPPLPPGLVPEAPLPAAAPLIVPPRVDLFDLSCPADRLSLATCRIAAASSPDERTAPGAVR